MHGLAALVDLQAIREEVARARGRAEVEALVALTGRATHACLAGTRGPR
jgi:hypothetical protein